MPGFPGKSQGPGQGRLKVGLAELNLPCLAEKEGAVDPVAGAIIAGHVGSIGE
jgi:hypothetical protein